jgi:hypothetical protein
MATVLETPSEYAHPLKTVPQKGMQDPDLDKWGLACNNARPRSGVFRAGSLWTAFNTSTGARDGPRNVVTWLEIAVASRKVVQQGCYGAPGAHYAYPAIMADSRGNALLVCVRAAKTEYASLLYAYRTSTMPAGKLHDTSELVQAGTVTHHQPDTQGFNRWADYNAVALDPVDDRIWMHGAIPKDAGAAASNTWSSWIAAWRAP